MDPAHLGGDMSPLYVPRKRKSVQPKSGVPCPVVQRIPERACELTPEQFPEAECDRQEAARVKRAGGRKRYQDLQNVAMGTVDYPTTSCSVMSSGGLANGAEPGSMAPPIARLPPRLEGKDIWPQGPEGGRGAPQDPQGWSPGRDRGPEPWDPGRDRVGHSGQEQAWGAGRDRAQGGPDQVWMGGQERGPEQGWNKGRGPERGGASEGPEQGWGPGGVQDQSWDQRDRERGNVWRPDVNMKKVQRGETERSPPVSNLPQPPGGGDSCPDGSGLGQTSSIRLSEDQKPAIAPTRKEPPSYPPGSQEERWQLQIAAKGRVTCPKCRSVSRKTVDGLRKHMDGCRLQPFTCPHCGKQLKSSTGMKYHIMADHSHLPSADDSKGLDDRAIKDKLRKILKRLGKLKCSKEGCSAAFTSIMGYVYHMKKCGKEEAELQKMLLSCSHCGKTYRSKAGLEYHLKSEHAPTPQRSEEDEALRARSEVDPERTASGRVQRASAQVANFHLAEIANNELPKDWPKRKFQSDLVPDDKKLKYARPGLPAFSQEVLRKWKNEVKLQRKVHCPNQGCGCTYTSVSGLKAHLGLCTKGDFEAGKYRCLICNKEFNSESGVKYHINSVHSQDWFVTNKKASKKFEKFLKNQPKELPRAAEQQSVSQYHHHHHLLQHHQHYHHHQHHQHQQPLQLQPLQHPLQPLHHLQHQPQFLHPPQGEQQLHYTPLEPPAGPVWVELDQREDVPGPEQAPIEMDVDVMDKQDEVRGRAEALASGLTEVERREVRGHAGRWEEPQGAGRRPRNSSNL